MSLGVGRIVNKLGPFSLDVGPDASDELDWMPENSVPLEQLSPVVFGVVAVCLQLGNIVEGVCELDEAVGDVPAVEFEDEVKAVLHVLSHISDIPETGLHLLEILSLGYTPGDTDCDVSVHFPRVEILRFRINGSKGVCNHHDRVIFGFNWISEPVGDCLCNRTKHFIKLQFVY